MLTYSVAALSFPLSVSSPVDEKEGGGCSTSAVYTELVQCGSLRMYLEARPDTESVLLQTSVSRSGESCRLQGRALWI